MVLFHFYFTAIYYCLRDHSRNRLCKLDEVDLDVYWGKHIEEEGKEERLLY